jgi:hypothetical protein
MDSMTGAEMWDEAEELTAAQQRSLDSRSSRKLATYNLWKANLGQRGGYKARSPSQRIVHRDTAPLMRGESW